MEELTIFIIIYAVFLIGESTHKKKPVADDSHHLDSWKCGTCRDM